MSSAWSRSRAKSPGSPQSLPSLSVSEMSQASRNRVEVMKAMLASRYGALSLPKERPVSSLSSPRSRAGGDSTLSNTTEESLSPERVRSSSPLAEEEGKPKLRAWKKKSAFFVNLARRGSITPRIPVEGASQAAAATEEEAGEERAALPPPQVQRSHSKGKAEKKTKGGEEERQRRFSLASLTAALDEIANDTSGSALEPEEALRLGVRLSVRNMIDGVVSNFSSPSVPSEQEQSSTERPLQTGPRPSYSASAPAAPSRHFVEDAEEAMNDVLLSGPLMRIHPITFADPPEVRRAHSRKNVTDLPTLKEEEEEEEEGEETAD